MAILNTIRDTVNNLSTPYSSLQPKNSNQLFVLEVKFKDAEPLRFSFPINPEEISIDQQNRVGVIFTYGTKVFQNLGRGLKTITISGHTGFKVAPRLNNIFSKFATATHNQEGKRSYLDLYSLIQAIKGENIFDIDVKSIGINYSTENIQKLEYVKLIDCHKLITYDVILRSDRFFRSKTQPNLYKYMLSFIVENEDFKDNRDESTGPGPEPPDETLSTLSEIRTKFQNIKNNVSAIFRSYNENISNYSDQILGVSDDLISIGTAVTDNIGLIETNISSRVDSISRMDALQESIKSMTRMINSTNILLGKISQSGSNDLFEIKINLKNLGQSLSSTVKLLTASYNEEKFKRDLTSIQNQGNIQVDKDAWARFDSDIYGLRESLYGLPEVDIKKIESSNSFLYGRDRRDLNYSTTDFNRFFSDIYQITFSESLSSYNIKVFNAYLFTDFERKNNVITQQSDTIYIANLSRNYGGKLNFEIQFSSIEEFLNSSDFKSIRKIKIKQADTLEDLISTYSNDEDLKFKNYKSIVAFLNNIEEPYIVTYDPLSSISNQQLNDYIGSFALSQTNDVINTITRNEFIQNYKYNFTETDVGAITSLPLYSLSGLADFKLGQQNIIDALTNRKFFVVLLKDIYSENIYVLFGVTALGSNDTTSTVLGTNIEKYFLSAIERGSSYNLIQDTIFEILNPFNLTLEILDRYAGLERFRADVETSHWTKCLTVIQNIYKEYVSTLTSGSFAWTESDKWLFIAGTDPSSTGTASESSSAIFTNFYYDTVSNVEIKYTYTLIAERKYKVLVNDDYLLLPSLSESFLRFEDVIYKDDVYKIDINQDFVKYEFFDIDTVNSGFQTYVYNIEFPLIRGIPNVKQAIVNRLDCPENGLMLHREYGMPNLLGKKNSLENLTLLRYYLYSQLNLENRVRSVDSLNVEMKQSTPDAIVADANITLVNNDETSVRIGPRSGL